MSRIAIYRGDAFLEEVVLSRAVMGLGRHPENDIVLDDRTLSRFHARVERRGDRFVVVDLGAQNGVHLNGNRIVGESNLAPGDRISLGRYLAVFEPHRAQSARDDDGNLDVDMDALDEQDLDVKNGNRDDAQRSPQQPLPPTSVNASQKTQDLRAKKKAATDPVVVLLFNGMEVSRHPISTGVTIGRSKNCEVVISLLGLSRRHAKLTLENDGAVVAEDLNSQNGTWVNNQRIASTQTLKHGDLLNFYDYAVLYLADGSVDVNLPGAAFAQPDVGSDVLSAAQTSQSEEIAPPKARAAAPVAAVSVAAPARAAAAKDKDLDLGEGSFFGDAFEAQQSAAAAPKKRRAAASRPAANHTGRHDNLSELLSHGDDAAAADAFAGGAAGEVGTDGEAERLDERTVGINASQAKECWAADRELLGALSNSTDLGSVSLEVTLAGKPYTQLRLVEPITRVGTDPRCELSLPKSSGLRPWHLTVLLVGGAVVLYRAARTGQILLGDNAVDMAVMRDGDELDLGKVRVRVHTS